MPRLDAERVSLFRWLGHAVAEMHRQIDAQLVDEFELPLAWFDVLAALQRSGGTLRVHELRSQVADNASSLSRRLDRMEEEGYVARMPSPTPEDRRAVTVTLTRRGRTVWRDANVLYRRGVQQHFAKDLSATDVAALQRMLGKW